ncbi:cell wall hydrolase [Evtepia sp.]|uniref:cell wall hydrolase n=1 Tax=Evtepia sp. TaxID=2773933 RepID=UPI002A81DB00|nr:cell wall hydrolase [Evtepia sp.]MDY4430272.1 cell wall hydrolase [Evtepia sp.]
MKKYLIAAMLCMVMLVSMVPTALAATNYDECMAAIQEQKQIQAQAHQTANKLRAQGYSDSSSYIQAAKATWNAAQAEIVAYQKLSKYTYEDIRILATTVYYEAGSTTEQLRQYVAQVALNRVADSRFPNTVKGVITQPGQYNTKYAAMETAQAIKNKDAANGTYNWETCKNSVKQAMMGKVAMPSNVLYQANFSQGKGLWKSVYFNSGYFASTSYFCYG